MKRLTIAIDGFSSGGKSTLARTIAARLGYVFVDSGAMYRAVTLYALRHGFVREGALDEAALIAAMDEMGVGFRFDSESGTSRVLLDGEDVSGAIRTIEVSDLVSRVSSIGAVREKLVAAQREMGRGGGVVMDGRDIGTVVFPDADLKIFLTADPLVRARRRYDELRAGGVDVSLAEIERNIRERDLLDQTREISPLRQAPDAIVIDNSDMTPQEQMERVMELVNSKR
ncbi:MAG: (d)CMP kinase [Alistipes sp.]|jgi:cytidylate kinase|nr:(d)CMP kinase [Alistipes sp.]